MEENFVSNFDMFCGNSMAGPKGNGSSLDMIEL